MMAWTRGLLPAGVAGAGAAGLGVAGTGRGPGGLGRPGGPGLLTGRGGAQVACRGRIVGGGTPRTQGPFWLASTFIFLRAHKGALPGLMCPGH